MGMTQDSGMISSPSKKLRGQGNWRAVYLSIICIAICGGYGIGFMSTHLFPGREELRHSFRAHSEITTSSGSLASGEGTSSTITMPKVKARQLKLETKQHKWPGDTVHSVMTSSGDHYQNFQGRIMYATYKMIQKMPGGERMTGFTRLLHRTVPDILMDEIPTFHVQPIKPQCDGWCDYPVANRPPAIKAFFDAVALNESMIQGAWVFMLECDYVYMQPMQVPGSAWDPAVPGVQFLYDYINPQSGKAKEAMHKLYNGPSTDIPASGPAPVLLRVEEWRVLSETYMKLSAQMEADEGMKKDLEWVREMYAWDAALPYHKNIKITTEEHTNSSTIVQPPFDEALGRAALCHYTWGALYHEGLPSKGGKLVYSWEKRDYNDIKFALKVPNIPMPPAYKDGWTLEFDAPLTRPRHDLVVLMLTQMNKAIDTLPDLTEKYKEFEPKLAELKKQWEEEHKAKGADTAKAAQRLMQ